MQFIVYSDTQIKVIDVNAYQPPDSFYDKFDLLKNNFKNISFKFNGGNNDRNELYIETSEIDEDEACEIESWMNLNLNER